MSLSHPASASAVAAVSKLADTIIDFESDIKTWVKSPATDENRAAKLALFNVVKCTLEGIGRMPVIENEVPPSIDAILSYLNTSKIKMNRNQISFENNDRMGEIGNLFAAIRDEEWLDDGIVERATVLDPTYFESNISVAIKDLFSEQGIPIQPIKIEKKDSQNTDYSEWWLIAMESIFIFSISNNRNGGKLTIYEAEFVPVFSSPLKRMAEDAKSLYTAVTSPGFNDEMLSIRSANYFQYLDNAVTIVSALSQLPFGISFLTSEFRSDSPETTAFHPTNLFEPPNDNEQAVDYSGPVGEAQLKLVISLLPILTAQCTPNLEPGSNAKDLWDKMAVEPIKKQIRRLQDRISSGENDDISDVLDFSVGNIGRTDAFFKPVKDLVSDLDQLDVPLSLVALAADLYLAAISFLKLTDKEGNNNAEIAESFQSSLNLLLQVRNTTATLASRYQEQGINHFLVRFEKYLLWRALGPALVAAMSIYTIVTFPGDIKKAYRSGDDSVVTGHVMLLISSGAFLLSLIPGANALAVFGLFLGVIGGALVTFTKDSDFSRWLEHCFFGKGYESIESGLEPTHPYYLWKINPYSGRNRNNYGRQISALFSQVLFPMNISDVYEVYEEDISWIGHNFGDSATFLRIQMEPSLGYATSMLWIKALDEYHDVRWSSPVIKLTDMGRTTASDWYVSQTSEWVWSDEYETIIEDLLFYIHVKKPDDSGSSGIPRSELGRPQIKYLEFNRIGMGDGVDASDVLDQHLLSDNQTILKTRPYSNEAMTDGWAGEWIPLEGQRAKLTFVLTVYDSVMDGDLNVIIQGKKRNDSEESSTIDDLHEFSLVPSQIGRGGSDTKEAVIDLMNYKAVRGRVWAEGGGNTAPAVFGLHASSWDVSFMVPTVLREIKEIGWKYW